MKVDSDTLMMKIIKNDLNYTGLGDKSLKRKTFLTKTLPGMVEDIRNETFDEIIDNSDNVQVHGLKIIIPTNIIDIYNRLEVLLGLKLSEHSDTLTEASSLINELHKKVQYKTSNNIEMLLINFLPNNWNYLVKYYNKLF